MMVAALLTLFVVAGPLDAPPSADPCLTSPLQLRWTDLISMGDTAKKLARPDCQVRLDAYGRFGGRMMQPVVVGHWALGDFRLFGEKVGFGFDMLWGTEAAFHGSLDGYRGPTPAMDQLILVPQLYLPEPWQRAVDTAREPFLLVTGAAITTWVIIEMVRSAHH